jgi:hypothetical protein
VVGATGFEPATPCAQGKLERPCEALLLERFAASKNSWAQFWAQSSGDEAFLAASDGDGLRVPNKVELSNAMAQLTVPRHPSSVVWRTVSNPRRWRGTPRKDAGALNSRDVSTIRFVISLLVSVHWRFRVDTHPMQDFRRQLLEVIVRLSGSCLVRTNGAVSRRQAEDRLSGVLR